MNLRFYIDPETADPHIHRHGVREQEVEDIMASPSEDMPGRRNSPSDRRSERATFR